MRNMTDNENVLIVEIPPTWPLSDNVTLGRQSTYTVTTGGLNDALCTCYMPTENLGSALEGLEALAYCDQGNGVISCFQLTNNLCQNAREVVCLSVIWAKSHVIANKLYY